MAAGASDKARSIDVVNYVNIGLMALSGAVALAFPFYLFLFSYAVLGPLHYLTEISWLHDRKYFLKQRSHAVPLVLATIAISVLALLPPSDSNARVGDIVLVITLMLAGFLVNARVTGQWMILGGVLVCAAVIFWTQPLLLLLIGVFVPTLVHVFVFTGAFMFAGNLKTRRVSGLLSLAAFIGVAACLLLWHPAFIDPGSVSDFEQRTYGRVGDDTSNFGFVSLNYIVAQLFGLGPASVPNHLSDFSSEMNQFLYHNPVARALMAFIAYAYAYHYLNWFSKTSVIGWHRASSKRLYAVMALWFLSLGIYAASYQTGLRWLFFLSLLHVVLELPLNYVTFFAIGRSVRSKPRPLAGGQAT